MYELKRCPYCQELAQSGCEHLALAAEGREFVKRCVQASQSQQAWDNLCRQNREELERCGEWSADKEDFTWLETAFSERFLKRLTWFGHLDYEWRTGSDPGRGGFCVLLWSSHPRRLWWELRDQVEKQCCAPSKHLDTTPSFNALQFASAPGVPLAANVGDSLTVR